MFKITSTLVTQWVIMVIIIGASFILTRSFKTVPDKKQNIAEMYVELISDIIINNMGEEYKMFIPFVGTLFIYLLMMNLVGLFGIKPPTTNYSVSLGLGIVSFLVIQGYAIKKVGIRDYFLGYFRPFWFLGPINLLERVSLPISLSLRLFGNMFAATVIMDLVYDALGKISVVAKIGIPIPLHAYFDLFDGSLQMFIFLMLTIINIKIISEH